MSFLNLDGKRVFVTGGTGTIGSRVVHELLSRGCFVTVYSRDQNEQFRMAHGISSKRLTFKNGDICNREILQRSMEDHDGVIHCAAAKHIIQCEKNADHAISVNIEGTRNVLLAAQYTGIKKCLLTSTDKSVEPSSVMGVTKFLAERLFLEFSSILPCAIVRLGNVFASNGSVVPFFQSRIKDKLPLIVNNPKAVRYFIAQKEAGKFIVDCLNMMQPGDIFIKKMKLITMLELAEIMVPNSDYPIEIATLTPGEKIGEKLFTEDESLHALDIGDYFQIKKTDARTSEGIKEIKESFNREEILQLLKDVK